MAADPPSTVHAPPSTSPCHRAGLAGQERTAAPRDAPAPDPADRGDHFTADWLRLREPFDHAARSGRLASLLAERLATRGPDRTVQIVDLGCGLGSNLRYLAPRLPRPQAWTVVDHDPALLDALRHTLRHRPPPAGVTVQSRLLDLRPGVAAVDWRADAVVASALLDLVSTTWLADLAHRCGRERTPVLAALSVDGRVRFDPVDGDDHDVMRWFRAHQHTDRGFGPSPGPRAADHFAHLLEVEGFAVQTAPADWWIPSTADGPILDEMIEGIAAAAAQMSPQPARVESWRRRRRALSEAGGLALEVGHVDVLGLPAETRPHRPPHAASG